MFEKGNQHAAKGKPIGEAIKRALAQDDYKRIRAGVEKLLDKAAQGDLAVLDWFANRTDGKPKQEIEQQIDATVQTFDLELAGAEELRKKIRGESA
jgi:hypothetical protein